jgi:glycosyltransferase involved in cell wall biosynthesis
LLNSIAKAGNNVDIVLPSQTSPKTNPYHFATTVIESKKDIPFLSYFHFLLKATKHLLRTKPQFLLFDFPNLPCFLALHLLGKTKGTMWFLSRPLEEKGLKRIVYPLQFKSSLTLGKLFVHSFISIGTDIKSLGIIPKQELTILPPPVGENFHPSHDNINQLKIDLGLEDLVGKTVLLYHGVLDKRRGVMQVLNLFYGLPDKTTLCLLIVGDGPASADVATFIKEKKATNIRFLGQMPYSKIPQIIAISDVGLVLLPSDKFWRYQTPTKLVEFLAMHKPVIASDFEGIRDITKESSLVVYLKSLEHATSADFNSCLQTALTLTKPQTLESVTTDSTNRGFSTTAIATTLVNLITQKK